MTQKTIVQFGAGNIGRSLVGQLFSRAGWKFVFVDAVPQIVDALNTHNRYLVQVKDECPEDIWVDNVSGILVRDRDKVIEAIATADVIGTAVGAAVLPAILPLIAQGLVLRTEPISVILCENLHSLKETARTGLISALPKGFDFASKVGVVPTSIGKMVPLMPASVREMDCLIVWAEAYNQIIADRDGFIGDVPDVPGLVLRSHFDAYVERKLFIHNLGHVAAAYLGFLKGKTFIWECVEDKAILEKARAAMWESAESLIRKFPQEFNPENQSEHIEDLLRRFGNKVLGDTVYRVGRDLCRKLSRDDRCIGAICLDLAQGVTPLATCEIAAAGLRFRASDENGNSLKRDLEFRHILETDGPIGVLQQICGLNPTEDRYIIDNILAAYHAFSPA